MLEDIVGNSFKIDLDSLRRGRLEVDFEWPLDDNLVPLHVIFPDSFPRLRPIVNLRGDPKTFPKRHCSPLDGNICLLGRDTGQWIENWTLVDLLQNQLKDALFDSGEQDPQGEPADVWWNTLGLKDSYCLVDSSWKLDGTASGRLKIRYEFDSEGNRPFAIRALVTEVTSENGRVLFSWDSKVPAQVVSGDQILVPWVYRDETVLPTNTQERVDEILSWFPTKPKQREFSGSVSGRMFAVLHKSEIGPGQNGIGWIFPIEFGHRKAFQPAKPGKTARNTRVSFIPVLRAGTTDIGVRVPATETLTGKKILIVGVGAVGASLAVDLARNGCAHLEILDFDTVEPGNSIRWSLGVTVWGKQKAPALSDFINREYPWCRAVPNLHRIGQFIDNVGDDERFASLLDKTDLVVDAAATYGVTTILGDFCREKNIPLVSLSASPPVTGGSVEYFHPQSGCPTCLEFAHSNKLISRAPGSGSAEGLQQPPGCAERTFTGASYDLTELSLQAMRVIVSAFLRPPEESTVYTLELRGNASPPSWSIDRLPKMEGCSCNTEP